MKNTLLTFVSAAFAFSLGAAETNECETVDDGGFSVEVSVDFLSDYLWRGTICNDNPVWQPSVTVGYDAGNFGKVSANVWASYDLTHKRGTATNSRRSCGAQEIDYTLSYANSIGPVGMEAGHIWYTFPNNNGSTDQELYASVSYENDIVTPSATAYWNYSDSAGSDVSAVYFSFGLEREIEIVDSLTLTPKASLGFGDHAYTDSEGGTELTDQTLGVALSYAVTEWLSVGAQVNYTWTPSHTLRHEGYMGEGKHQLVWGGVSASVSF
ncbi:MAG: hypothetical protein K6F50_01080 [Kiritimatiellae bacterium]|nr:hypothetical protein [Kiritimatiellia bacterium]